MANIQISGDRYGWSVNDWAGATGISRASVYEILTDLESIKFGGRRLILTHPREWLESLRDAPATDGEVGAR
jgi:hypothetical protein